VSVLRSLPGKAQTYIWVVAICGIATVILALRHDFAKVISWNFFVLLALTILVNPIRIPILKNTVNITNPKDKSNDAALTLTFIFISIALLHNGITSAILVNGFSLFFTSIIIKQKWFQILYK
jgi:uncharacterized protein YhhL (DUF1145 family)